MILPHLKNANEHQRIVMSVTSKSACGIWFDKMDGYGSAIHRAMLKHEDDYPQKSTNTNKIFGPNGNIWACNHTKNADPFAEVSTVVDLIDYSFKAYPDHMNHKKLMFMMIGGTLYNNKHHFRRLWQQILHKDCETMDCFSQIINVDPT